jgi:hypothetical protein
MGKHEDKKDRDGQVPKDTKIPPRPKDDDGKHGKGKK